jgi:tRNA nucleotidyltransferase (CCA-adding enzyme)
MHIILTHEQADFDALGALLGAHLLDEHAIPVLPRRINRNARAFITMYGAELPFVDARDLPSEPIKSVTLVDTQSLNTLKGMSQQTRVHVVDHHPRRSDLPENWTIQLNQLGACTTRFVEELREINGNIGMIQATLLLLGVHEDTGSLTYASTTARDAHAVAYLLEQGASLRLANQYLNPPLSDDQRRVYEQLLSAAETHTIHDHHVVIACAYLSEMVEEISSVAHKMRDLLDPDALLLLVHTNEGVRLVARSTTDNINVAELTARFGGGGHDRAAGSLMHPDTLVKPGESGDPLDTAYQKLIKILPEHVRPQVTVGQLMSPRPRVLPASTPAQEAAQLMQRYGYEGYPIVENGKVLGLLTRRAVDRALAHKLNLTAGSLMEAGEVSIHASDSIESLQRVMTSTGWGQVPVTDAESGEVIGIVTRTDLLKTLAGREARMQEKPNLTQRLEKLLPPAVLALLQVISAQAHARRQPAYIVGGFVRDLLLERPSLDFDIVVEGDAIELARSLSRKYGGRIVSHSRFGTAKWQIGSERDDLVRQLPAAIKLRAEDLPEMLDLISARTEFYDYPTALPTVERSSIKLDLHRRDFTFNTLALRLDGRHYGTLYDYWGGLTDLRRGLVRVLHSLSFVDDPTRILRAVRFEQRFEFRIEARTLELITEAHELLRQVSGQRLRHEIDLMLSESRAPEMLARLDALDLLKAIHPALFWSPELIAPLRAVLFDPLDIHWDLPGEFGHTPVRRALAYLVWLMRLSPDDILSIAERMTIPANLRQALLSGERLWHDLPGMMQNSPGEIVHRLDSVPKVTLYALLHLNPPVEAKIIIQRYIGEWRQVQPVIDGRRLQALGVTPGPVYKDILESLRKARLNGEISSEEEELALVNKWIGSGIEENNRIS